MVDEIDAYHAPLTHIEATYADFGFPPERLTVIPNILDERFSRPHESDFDAPLRPAVRRIARRTQGCRPTRPDPEPTERPGLRGCPADRRWRWWPRTDMEQRAADSAIEDRVTFTGWLPNDDLPSVFAAHDCFVYPGRWDEPFGRVFLEALATGTPVVASDVGSVAEIVGDGGVTTDGSVDGFVAALRDLFDGEKLATRSSAAGREVAAYRAETVVPQFEELYERVIER